MLIELPVRCSKLTHCDRRVVSLGYLEFSASLQFKRFLLPAKGTLIRKIESIQQNYFCGGMSDLLHKRKQYYIAQWIT